MKLTFVTTNAGKVRELAALLSPAGVEVIQDGRGYVEVQAATLAEVTEAGADALLASGLTAPFILEDSGLFVTALKGFPGVYSRHALDTIGVAGLLRLLTGTLPAQRGAAFQADLLLVAADGSRHHFSGRCDGHIALQAAGTGGFGFDPVFIPDDPIPPPSGTTPGRTFAELPPTVKGRLSHRGAAARGLLDYLGRPRNQTAKP